MTSDPGGSARISAAAAGSCYAALGSALGLCAWRERFIAYEAGGPAMERTVLLLREVLLQASVLGLLLSCVLVGAAGARLAPAGPVRERRFAAGMGVAFGVALGGLVLPLGASLASGAWISLHPAAPVVRYGGLLPAALAGWFGAPLLLPPPRGRLVVSMLRTLALGALALALTAADLRLLRGTLPDLHLALSWSASLCAFGALQAALGPALERMRSGVLSHASFAVAALLFGAALAGWFGADPRFKAELVAQGKLSARLVGQGEAEGASRRLLGDELQRLHREPVASWLPLAELATPSPTTASAAAPIPNVLLVIVDAMRADCLEPVRAGRAPKHVAPGDTPFMDGFVQQSVRFSRAYANATMTRKSLPSLLHSSQVHEPVPALAEHLAQRMQHGGRRTLAVITEHLRSHQNHRASARGFERLVGYDDARDQGRVAELFDGLLAESDRPFFAWVHLNNLHHPGFDTAQLPPMMPRAESYRRALGAVDRALRELVAVLDRRQLGERTLVVLASDHGEAIGEHGADYHGSSLYEAEVRVPLVLRARGYAPRVVDAPVANLDLLPTLLDLAGVEPKPEPAGRSLRALLEGSRLPERPVFFESASRFEGVLFGGQKLIHDSELGSFLRYDVVRDPDERRNLFEPGSATDRKLLRLYLGASPERLQEVRRDPQLARLAADLLARHPGSPASEPLSFVLRVAAASGHPAARAALAALAARAPDPRVRALASCLAGGATRCVE